jgi:pilus assembly protein Flp/PilA
MNGYRRCVKLSKIELTAEKQRKNNLRAFRRVKDVPEQIIETGANVVTQQIRKFVGNESGATAIEYALIASLVAVAIIASLGLMSGKLQNTFNEVAGNLK